MNVHTDTTPTQEETEAQVLCIDAGQLSPVCARWRLSGQIPKSVLWSWTDQGNAEGCAGWAGGWWGHCECAELAIKLPTGSPDNQRPRRRREDQSARKHTNKQT